MRNILKADCYKSKSSHALWIILGAMTAFCWISVLIGTYENADTARISIGKDIMVPFFACAAYGAILLSEDFSNGAIRFYIAAGYKKSSILIAKLIHYLAGCSVLLFLYPCLSVLFIAVVKGTETSIAHIALQLFFDFLKVLPLYFGLLGIFFLFAFVMKKGSIVAGVSIASAIILVVFTNKFYDFGVSALKYSPITQMGLVYDGKLSFAYCIAVIISLAVMTLCILGSMERFKRDELL